MRARAGDKAAFGNLVKLHQKRLLRMVLGMVGDVDAAMDIVQESFVKAYQALDSFEPGRPFYPWLSTIATNLSINRIRQVGRNTDLDTVLDVQADKGPDPSQILQLKENDRRFFAALKEMPTAYREVFVLRNYDELDYDQIAARRHLVLLDRQDGLERRSFEEAARAELSAPEQWPNTAIGFYVRIGFYTRFLAEYSREFSPEQIRILLFDDLEASPAAFMTNVLTFLGVDPGERLDTSARFNTTQAVQAEAALRKYGLKSGAKRLQATMPAWLYRAIYRGYLPRQAVERGVHHL